MTLNSNVINLTKIKYCLQLAVIIYDERHLPRILSLHSVIFGQWTYRSIFPLPYASSIIYIINYFKKQRLITALTKTRQLYRRLCNYSWLILIKFKTETHPWWIIRNGNGTAIVTPFYSNGRSRKMTTDWWK